MSVRFGARPAVSYLSAIVAGVVILGGGVAVLARRAAPCVTLDVSSSTEKVLLLQRLAKRYGDAHRALPSGGCARIRVDGMNSGAAMAAIAQGWTGAAVATHPNRPAVWLPTSSMWVTDLRAAKGYPGRASLPVALPSLAHSPLVIAMPKEMAQALGWPRKPLTWRDVLSLDSDAWARLKHPDWGRFTYAKDDPTQSTSGMAATVAAYYAASGKRQDLTVEDTKLPAVQDAVRQVEANVVAHPPDIMDYLQQLQDADTGQPAQHYISAMVLQEELAYLHNQGNPRGDPAKVGDPQVAKPAMQFVAVHPADGTIMLDHPYVTLPGATGTVAEAAGDFLTYLREPASQQAFAGLGFRDDLNNAPAPLAASLGFAADQHPSMLAPPSAEVMGAVLAGWKKLSKRANILLVVDKSGSMLSDSGIPGRGDRMEAAKQALLSNLRLLNPDDRVGLWSFASDPGHLHPQLRAIERVGDDADLADKIRSLQPATRPYDDTALCVTIRDAQQALLDQLPAESATPDETINAVVVLTDGKDDYQPGNCRMSAADSAGRGPFLGDTLKRADPHQRVKVFGIAFSSAADQAALTDIASRTGAVALDATGHPEKIDNAFATIFTTVSSGH